MKRKPLKRRASRHRFDHDAASIFRALAIDSRCAICGTTRHLEVHHVLPQRVLKAEGHRDLLWDVRNGMVLCRWDHARHENAFARIPASRISHEAWSFAQELGLDWWLERNYGAQDEAAA